MTKETKTSFRFFPFLTNTRPVGWMSTRSSVSEKIIELFNRDNLQNKFATAILRDSIIPPKELLECCEFFERIRKTVKNDTMVDLCCGHGLLGILFAMFEKKVNKVILVDKTEPPSRKELFNTAKKLAPWIENKICNLKEKIKPDAAWISEGTSIISAHACGELTDLCIETAIIHKGNIALLPCCYPKRNCPSPQILHKEFGLKAAWDIHRTYKLENSGYLVRWTNIPEEITPMNRIITGKLR